MCWVKRETRFKKRLGFALLPIVWNLLVGKKNTYKGTMMDPGTSLILCLHQHHIAEYHNHFRNSGERGLQNAWFLWCKEGFHWLQVSKISLYLWLFPGWFVICFDIFRFGRCSNTFSAAGVSCTGEEGSVANCRWYLWKFIKFIKWSTFLLLVLLSNKQIFQNVSQKTKH